MSECPRWCSPGYGNPLQVLLAVAAVATGIYKHAQIHTRKNPFKLYGFSHSLPIFSFNLCENMTQGTAVKGHLPRAQIPFPAAWCVYWGRSIAALDEVKL